MNDRYAFCSKFRVLIAIGLLVMEVACASDGRAVLSDTAVYNNLVLKIEANRSQIRAGDSVQIRFTITNDGKQPVTIESTDIPVLDITVRDFKSKQLLLSWATQNPDKVSYRVEWKPGESKVLELVWTALAEPSYIPGQLVHISGGLNVNGKLIQAAGVDVCVGLGCQ